MRCPSRHVLTVLTLSVLQAIARAEPLVDFRALTSFLHRSWTAADGLPGMVESIAQTPDGYLWLGTQHGIVRFDGERMTTLTRSATFDLKSERITVLLVDRGGQLWAGTYGGGLTEILSGRIIRTYSTGDGLSSPFITALFEDHRGHLWVAQKNGAVSILVDGAVRHTYVHQTPTLSTSVTSFVETAEGNILAADESGVFDPESPSRTAPCAYRSGTTAPGAVSMLKDGSGDIWIGTNAGLYRCQQGHMTKVQLRQVHYDFTVWSMASDPQGGLWLGTSDGIARLHNGVFEGLREKGGLSSDVVKSVFIDSSGGVWAGTWGGLDRLSERFISSYSMKQGLSSNQVWSVVEDQHGQIWVGTNGGLDKITGTTVQSVERNRLPSRSVFSTQEAPDGSLWFATLGGLSHLRDTHLSIYGRKDGLASDAVRAIFWTRGGALLASPRQGGLFIFRNGRFEPYLQIPESVHSISEGRDGSIWLSSTGRLLHAKNGQVTSYGGASDDYAYSLEDIAGRIWAGSWLHGLVCIKDDRLIRMEGLGHPFDDHIFHIFEDRSSHLWLATPHGLFRVSEQDLERYMQGRQKHVDTAEFGMDDGFPSTGCNGAEQNSGFTDSKGRFWVPTGRGLAMIDPSMVSTDTRPPNTIIEQVQVDDQTIVPAGKIEVPPEPRRIVFTYTGISLAAPHEVRFRYRLDGFDQGWIDAGSTRSVSYTGLRPGSYTFRVMARNRYGLWRESAPVFLRVTQPFYRSDWFFAACGLVLTGSVVLAYRWRIAGLRARNRAALEERTRMAREIHDTLLQGVAGASLVLEAIASSVENQDARQKFDRALDEMQLTMRETRCALFDMRADEHESDLLTRISRFGQAVAEAAGRRFTFLVRGEPWALDPELERQLFKIVREAILNAIKHSGGQNVETTVEFRPELIRLIVSDNGCGFQNGDAGSGGHWGLVGMQERAEALGGTCIVTSAPGGGTTVVTELRRVARRRRATEKTNAVNNLSVEGTTNADSNTMRR